MAAGEPPLATATRPGLPSRSQPPAQEPHLPYRPIWCCRTCGAPWPCGPARLTLVAEYRDDPIGLSVHLCSLLHEAVTDLYKLNPYGGPDRHSLFERFVGWTRRSPQANPSDNS